jgi:hypothetical protein
MKPFRPYEVKEEIGKPVGDYYGKYWAHSPGRSHSVQAHCRNGVDTFRSTADAVRLAVSRTLFPISSE